MNMFEDVKLSVIVPVYHVEDLLEDCLKSIVSQTWKNMEIIVVDDGSCNGSDAIVEAMNDERIVLLKHEKNRGLLRARITGMQYATGKYIAFVDGDDTVSIDYFRLLIKKAEETSADVVVGNTVFVEESGRKIVSSLHKAIFCGLKLEGDAIKEKYFEQEGNCHSWHNVWNKLYSKTIIEACLDDLDKMEEHVTMGEDILFSSVFLYNACKLETSPNAIYFYARRSGSSVGENTKAANKYIKNLADLKNVFDFVDEYLSKKKASTEILEHFKNFRRRYGKIWKDLAEVWKQEPFYAEIEQKMNDFCDSIPTDLEDNGYFGLFEQDWGDGVETIKKAVMSDKYQYVSFDVFDTAIMRPFGKPDDIFILLNKEFEKYVKSNISFEKIRKAAEQSARVYISKYEPEREDVTLVEIYNQICENYGISKEVADKLMQEELMLEYEMAVPRETIKEIYEVAVNSGKKILFISDMYLPVEHIEKILNKCGYNVYEKIFVSAEYSALKQTRKLYEIVLEELGIDPDHMLHMGDNFISDAQRALETGIDAYHLPKVWDLFENAEYKYPTGNRKKAFKEASGLLVNENKIYENPAIRSMMELAAMKFFDNPFVRYDNTSDYDYNPYYVGYFLVGTHLLGAMKWIQDTAEEKHYGRIIYTSRDGWLYMQAHNIWKQYFEDVPDMKYVYVSRRAMLPAMIVSEADLYNLPIEVSQYTPEMLLDLLEFCADKEKESDFWCEIESCGLVRDERFANDDCYNMFIKCFIKTAYSEELRIQHLLQIKEYFGFLRKTDAIFDMGYSGRIHKAIVDATEKSVDALFIHKEAVQNFSNARKGRFKINEFLSWNPLMPDLLREHMISDTGKACIGYCYEDGKVVPKLEEIERNHCDKFVVESIQQGALDFVNDFLKNFSEYMEYMDFRPTDAALALEGFLGASAVGDRNLFCCSYFEDIVYSGNPHNNVAQYINEQHRIMCLIKNQ